MTADELQLSFREKISTLLDPNLVSSFIISKYLTEAQLNIIEDIVKTGLSDEFGYKAIQELLVIDSVFPNTYSLLPNSQTVELDAEVYRVLMERCDITFTGGSFTGIRSNVWVKPISLDYYNANKNHPDKQPYYDLVWRLDGVLSTLEQKRHILISDGTYVVSNYYYTGLKRPTDIDIVGGVTSMLDSTLHVKVVDEAVKIFKLHKGDLNSAQAIVADTKN